MLLSCVTGPSAKETLLPWRVYVKLELAALSHIVEMGSQQSSSQAVRLPRLYPNSAIGANPHGVGKCSE
jgi:hypothetical protein